MEHFPECDIDYICNKISKNFEENKDLTSYIKEVNEKVKTFLKKKLKSEKIDCDLFVQYIVDNIKSRRIKENTHVGILAAQSIGEPVTQSALSYFHNLTGESDNINGLKELYNVTHNKMDFSVAEFYLKSKDYDSLSKKIILNSMKYMSLNDVILDVVYDGFTLRFYLCKHTIFAFRFHPQFIFDKVKKYLNNTKNILGTWEASINFSDLYIQFSQPSSKLLDWLDDNQIEYLVDVDMLCVFKQKISENENIMNYFNKCNLKFEENDKYYTLDSGSINLNKDDINNILDNVVLSGTKGVVKIATNFINDELCIEVTGLNLKPLFNNEYIDKNRSRYIVYGNSMDINFELRKQNILMQLQRIVNVDSSSFYNNQHIELLTNFMCRDNTVLPMSRFGMKKSNYSFISQLSFEDPYSVIQNIFYGVEDKLTSISSKIITGIYY